jgi:hypothetical protein
MSACLACMTLIFFAIGLPLYLSGCNEAISSQCYSYDIVPASVTYSITNATCRKCIRSHSVRGGKSSYTVCEEYLIYACYQTDVRAVYSPNAWCPIRAATNFLDYSVALSYLRAHFAPGSQVVKYVRKNDGKCVDDRDVSNYAIAGLVFLLLSGSCALCLLCMGCIYRPDRSDRSSATAGVTVTINGKV